LPYKDKTKQKEYQKNYYKYHEKLGTTDFNEHITISDNGKPDFDKEQKDIDEEFKKLHLKKKYW
jgi:hypothetical protein